MTDLQALADETATAVLIADGMRLGDLTDRMLIDQIEAQPRKCWKRYAQAFSGLDAEDVAEVTEAA